jgi:hypothetical protein
LKFLQHEHPTVLDPKPGSPGFVIGKNWKDQDMIAAIPVMGSKHQLAIIQHGSVVKYCRNLSSAQNFIRSHSKKSGTSKLPF